jgi:uncharacterized protein (TIGR00255 family)
MLQSMTGFGRASNTFKEKTIIVEIRSLNSKVFDLRLKVPSNFKEKELELRRIITEQVERGKVDIVVTMQSSGGDDSTFALNTALFKKYYNELTALSNSLGMPPQNDMMQAILRLPNVVMNDDGEMDDAEWNVILETSKIAMKQFIAFREQEGVSMEAALSHHANTILSHLHSVQPFEAVRIDKVRQRMYQNLEEFLGKENVDKNRYEQEVLFYLEKIDITEEKVRLEQHCNYFSEELAKANSTTKGRTLNFISQEMGREINTLGAKAYSSEIQRYVVGMKDELEKIKELLANIA